jgi:hypothetical protein
MKAPLPQKYTVTTEQSERDYNEIIDYLAELTEVVNKQEEHIANMRDDWSEVEKDNPAFAPMPTLKEQLLEALPKRKVENVTSTTEPNDVYIGRNSECRGYNRALSDVKDIINRLIP